MLKWGAIFDWDGVIIDSSGPHEQSWELLSVEMGLPLPEGHFKRGFGMKNSVIIPDLLGWTKDPEEIQNLGDRKEELYREILREKGVTVLPGVSELLSALSEQGVPCVVGTSTPRLNVQTIFELTGLGSAFQEIVSADDVSRGKPDPEVFLKASQKIEVLPSKCVVFEDALVGIKAALSAGMKVVAVATTEPAEKLKQADLVFETLSEVRVDQLEQWFSE